MLSREQLQQKLIEIDQQMNNLIADNPAMQVSYNPASFPVVPIVLAAILGASYQYGSGMVPVPPQYWDYQLYAAGVFAALSALLLLRWVAGLGKRSNKAYRQANEKLAELRKQKAILQAQLRG